MAAPPDAPPRLRLAGISKSFPGVKANDDISFSVRSGEIHGLIGENGAGKSTLVKIIYGVQQADEGEIGWEGRPIQIPNPKAARRLGIGMVFQHFNLVHRSKVITNVLAGRLGYINPAWSLLNRFPKADIEKAIKQMERVGIADKADHRADELSGGQQQRVGIARALMQDPEMILADEPVASLDPVLAHSIMKHLEDINDKDGVTVLCSLHFLDLVHRYADRVVALNAGQLVFEGLPNEIDDKKFKDIYGRDAERVG